jgi:uncharacterized protein YaeQ
MALGATIYVFNIDLADSDRSVYQALELRVARHPSETEEFLVTRVLAYCFEYAEGIAFSNGLSDPDEPTIAIRDLTGQLETWIDIGAPEAARLHRASKAAPRVVVYTHKDPASWLARLAGERIHRAASIKIHALDRTWLTDLVGRLSRRMAFALTISERHVYLTIGEDTLPCVLETLSLDAR